MLAEHQNNARRRRTESISEDPRRTDAEVGANDRTNAASRVLLDVTEVELCAEHQKISNEQRFTISTILKSAPSGRTPKSWLAMRPNEKETLGAWLQGCRKGTGWFQPCPSARTAKQGQRT